MNKTEAPNIDDITCPLCQHDEYLLSESGEKFTCASCGFHTKQFSKVVSLQLGSTPPKLQNSLYHQLSSACH
ncbi:hypothetical protein F4W18_05380 [Vibrio gigantis]|uniref:Transcription initiation factor TFIIIB n=1 Tax=Vibrio gigantis TaxID=296199 RepID=A0A5M9P385_9VIBR|nr:hypothetical protein F4W18_05380 [Vibrio gigantis]